MPTEANGGARTAMSERNDERDANDRDDRRPPLRDLAERAHDGDSSDDPAVEDLFERESVDGIGVDALWEQVRGDESPEAAPADREIREISTAAFCHRCPHFSKPPAVRCEHDGTEILAMPSRETFRVVDCPRVLETEALEDDR